MAMEYKGIHVRFEADTTDLSKALGVINSDIRSADRAGRQLSRALKVDPTSTKMLSQALEQAGGKVDAQRRRVETLRAAYEQTGSQLASVRTAMAEMEEAGEAGTAAYHELETAAAKLSEAHERLERDLVTAEAYLKGYSRESLDAKVALEMQTTALGKASAALEDAGSAMRNIGSSMSGVGDKLTAGVTAPLAAVAGYSVNAAISIDDALTSVRKTVDMSADEYDRLRDSALELSKVQPVPASTILEIEAMGGQLGIANENLEKFATVISGLDVATNMDTEQAATNLARFANVTNMSRLEGEAAASAYEAYGNTVVALGNTTATTESEISDFSLRIGSAGTQAGMSEASILGISAAMSSLGLEAAAGGSSFSRTITDISVAVATGSDDLQKYAAVAGMSADEFATYWREDATGAFIDFIGGVSSSSEDMNVILDDLGITELRQSDAIRRMAGNTDLLRESVARANAEWEGGSALATEVANRNESASAKLETLKNRLDAVATELGGPLLDAGLDLLDAAQPLIEQVETAVKAFAEMDEAEQQQVIQMAALAAGAGPVLSVTGRLVDGLGGVVGKAGGAIEKLIALRAAVDQGSNSLAGIGEALEYAGIGINPLAIGIGTAVVTIGMFASAAYDAHQRAKRFDDAVADMSDDVSAARTTLDGGARAVEAYGTASSHAAVDIDTLVKSMEDHSKAIEDIRSGAAESIGMLGQYKTVIDEAAAGGEEWGKSAENMALLEWALSGLKDMTGEAYTAEQVLSGAYGDERDEVSNLISDIDGLIAKRQEEARVSAYQDMYTEAYKAQTEAADQLAAAQATLAERHESYVESRMRDAGLSRETAERQWKESDSCQHLSENVDRLSGAYSAASQRADGYAAAMAGAAEATASDAGALAQWVGSNVLARASLATFGDDVNATVRALEEHGVTVEDLARLSESEFSEMAASCGGSIDTLIAKLTEYRDTDPGDKQSEVIVDPNDAPEATRDVKDFNKASLGPAKTGSVTVHGVDGLKRALELIQQWSGSDSWIGTKTAKLVTQAESIAGNAAGGYIPRHADGFMVTRPTLTKYGWIGEAGREVFDAYNKSLVPIDNHVYTSPLADQLGRATAEHLAPLIGQSAESIDYDRMAEAVAHAMARASLAVKLDDRVTAGYLAPAIETEMARRARLRGYGS